jgi:cell division protein FtsL
MVGVGFMTMPKRFVQAYRQAPWRIQTQRVALLLIVAVLAASVVWVMLSVTVQAATAGLEIQNIEYQQEELQRKVSHLQSTYAELTAAALMRERATELGFEPLSPEVVTYLSVPGYVGRQTAIHAPPPSNQAEHRLIKPAYTLSLWEWMLDRAAQISRGQTP